MLSRQPSLTSTRRDAWLEVDLSCVENNVKTVLGWLSPRTQLMAVVKSDAYGHGAIAVSPVLIAAGATWLGVASVDEGCQLRDSGVRVPILILSPCPAWAIPDALKASLDLTVTASGEIRDIAAIASQHGLIARIHLKVDTGMHRLGARIDLAAELADLIRGYANLKLSGVFSHLARADEESSTRIQNQSFRSVLDSIKDSTPEAIAHLASGEAARRFPWTHYDLVRVGLYLWGLEPTAVSPAVSPALSVRGRINHMQDIECHQAVGYNWTWTCDRPSRIASIPIGYADGVDRHLSNQITGLLSGRPVPQVGLISMDQMLFDVTDVPDSQIGDVITLIGSEPVNPAIAPARRFEGSAKVPSINPPGSLYLADWANSLGTITYELACRLRARLPRIYTRRRTETVNLL